MSVWFWVLLIVWSVGASLARENLEIAKRSYEAATGRKADYPLLDVLGTTLWPLVTLVADIQAVLTALGIVRQG